MRKNTTAIATSTRTHRTADQPTRARSTIDREAIEQAWCIGKLTQKQIAIQHGISEEAMRKRFKKYGITRDLSDTVKTATKAALIEKAKIDAEQIRVKVGTELGQAQLSAVASAVSENVRIIESHRQDIAALKRLSLAMAQELAEVTDKQKVVAELIEAIGDQDATLAQSEYGYFL